MTSLALLQPYKQSFPLIEFKMGTLAPVRVCLTKSPVMFEGEIYRPEPAIRVELPEQGGGLAEDPCKMVLPLNREKVHSDFAAMCQIMATPRAFPRTSVRVMELVKSSPTDTKTLYHYEGVISKAIRNPSGRTNVLEIEVETELREGVKDVSLGRRCDPQCDLIYGGSGCYVDNTQFFGVGTYYPAQFKQIRRAKVRMVFSAGPNPRLVTLTMDPVTHPGADIRTITEQPKGWWEAAYIERDGLRIRVQAWVWDEAGATNRFVLNQMPPVSWDNAVGTLIPDCNRTREACADRNNIGLFGGLGYGIPAYNPTLELPNE